MGVFEKNVILYRLFKRFTMYLLIPVVTEDWPTYDFIMSKCRFCFHPWCPAAWLGVGYIFSGCITKTVWRSMLMLGRDTGLGL